ncbi:MAG: GTPase RsgA [Clostridia bacterium]|nr:GTPase RsgA [Clostridia bacterium]
MHIKKYGYNTIKTNSLNGDGIEKIREALKNNTSVFAGQSGVRKINSYK